jgi:hypothetical protein
MPRIALDLNKAEDCQKVKGQWRVGQGLVPGQPNEGLTAQLLNSPVRLPDYDDSRWEVCSNIRASRSTGFTFAWYRINIALPEQIAGLSVAGSRVFQRRQLRRSLDRRQDRPRERRHYRD